MKFGLIKFNPIAGWTSEDVWNYIRENDVIYNPLHDHNYPSIGCTHCTRQVAEVKIHVQDVGRVSRKQNADFINKLHSVGHGGTT